MINPPNNVETKELGIFLEEGLLSENPADKQTSFIKLNQYIYSALDSLAQEDTQMVVPASLSEINALSHTQLWSLCFLGVFDSLMTQRNIFAIECALRTYFEENIEELPEGNSLNEVEVANCIFDTEFDIHFIFIGLEVFFQNSAIKANELEPATAVAAIA